MIDAISPLADEDIPAIRFEIPEAPKPNVAPTRKPATSAASEPKDDSFMDEARRVIRQNEGLRHRLYRDSKGHYTIGIGHYVSPERVAQFQKRGKLSAAEVNALFDQDLQKHAARARQLLGAEVFDAMPSPVKVAALDGVFRGDLSGSPETLRLLREGRYREAAVEYLNHNEYRDSVRRNRAGEKHGVAARMERNAEAFRNALP